MTRYDMLELPEECPDYDYGLKVACKKDTPENSLATGLLNVGENSNW